MADTTKYCVVGVGPVGGILTAYLQKGGMDVTAVDIFKEHLDRMREQGLRIEGVSSLDVKVDKTFYSLEEARDAGARFDVVFVCVKATAIKFVAPLIPEVLDQDGVAVSWQNGLDTEAGIIEVVGEDRTLRGAVNYAGNLVGLGRVNMTFFHPPNYIGVARGASRHGAEAAGKVAEALTKVGLETQYTEEIQRHVWAKAIRNAGLMPVSALTGMDMAQVMESERSLHLVEKLLQEALDVSAKVGHVFDRKFYEDTLEYYRGAGHHMPSMRGDVEDGRRTETEFLNHKIAEYGEEHGVDAPYNRALANLLLCIDELAAQRQRKAEK